MSGWGRVARLYDRQLWLERAALSAAIDLAEIGESDRLLDLATGTGALLRLLARRRPAPREAIGIDSSPQMLARAPALPAGWGLQCADAAKLPFADASFDVVTAAYLLHLLEAPERSEVLGEARRVMGPRGRLVVVTVAPPRSKLRSRVLSTAFRIAPRGSVIIAGLRPLDPRPNLEESGFVVRRAVRTARGYPSLVVAASPADGAEGG